MTFTGLHASAASLVSVFASDDRYQRCHQLHTSARLPALLSSGNTSQGRKTKIFSFLHNLFISHLTSSNPCSNQCNKSTPFSQLIRHFTQWQTCIRTPTGCKVNISRALQLYKYLYKHHSWLIFVHISVLFSINMCRLNQSHEPPPLVDVC